MKNKLTAPFGIDGNYSEIKAISFKVIILDSIDSARLGIYDTQNRYEKSAFLNKEYSTNSILTEDFCNVLAKENSFFQRYAESNGGIYDLGDKNFCIKGVYDSVYPLFLYGKSYIYSYFSCN